MHHFRNSMIITIAVLTTAISAQPGPGSWDGNGPRRQEMRERLETVKIWQLTDAVGLTSEQSKEFFPIYSKFQKDHEKIENRRTEIIDSLDELAAKDQVSEEKIKKSLEDLTAAESQFSALRSEFIKDVSGVLTVKQIAKLVVFEDRFRQRLQKNIRDIRRGMGGPGRDRPR
jgi:Spy/CpxP family protein refolding chaperone